MFGKRHKSFCKKKRAGSYPSPLSLSSSPHTQHTPSPRPCASRLSRQRAASTSCTCRTTVWRCPRSSGFCRVGPQTCQSHRPPVESRFDFLGDRSVLDRGHGHLTHHPHRHSDVGLDGGPSVTVQLALAATQIRPKDQRRLDHLLPRFGACEGWFGACMRGSIRRLRWVVVVLHRGQCRRQRWVGGGSCVRCAGAASRSRERVGSVGCSASSLRALAAPGQGLPPSATACERRAA